MELRAISQQLDLLTASQHGFTTLVKGFLEEGVDVDFSENNYHYTPLMLASWNRHPEIVQLLIEAGANVNARSIDGRSPIHGCSDISILNILLDAGADINAPNCFYTSPLDWALTHGSTDTVLFLLNKGANPDELWLALEDEGLLEYAVAAFAWNKRRQFILFRYAS